MEPGRQISGGFFCVHMDSSSGQQVRVSQTGRIGRTALVISRAEKSLYSVEERWSIVTEGYAFSMSTVNPVVSLRLGSTKFAIAYLLKVQLVFPLIRRVLVTEEGASHSHSEAL